MVAKRLCARRRPALRRARLQVEVLETRDLLATVAVDAGMVVRPVNDHVLGVNLASWDSSLNTNQTRQMVQAAGLTMFRFPGGSSSDEFHFNAPPAYNGQGTAASMAYFIASVGGTGLVTLNYGTGSPQEAAAFLAYLNGSTSNATVIGSGEQWNAATNTWVQKNWATAGYWAQLRAAQPKAPDDGLNFLRLGRAAPLGIHYFEVGNEIYGSWETDDHGLGGDTGKPHDPATYVKFAKQFAVYAAQIDPTISIGEVTGSVSYDNNWTANVLGLDVTQGFTPGFLSDHIYVQGPGSESDSKLLLDTVSNPSAGGAGSPDDWSVRAAAYRSLLNKSLGAGAGNVELLATEFNSVYASPGKQSTSLVNGLFLADALGGILETEYNAADVWDLRNGWGTGNNNSPNLYGWRQGGDYGLLGSGGGSAPATGTYIPYPNYFAEQLVAKLAHNGDTVIHSSSSDTSLSVHAVKQANGHLDLLVINKSSANSLTGQFQITGFTPSTQAQLWQYGMAQDTAQSKTTDGHSALASLPTTLTLTGSYFGYVFPAYSMSVLDLAPAGVPTATTLTASATSAVYGQPITFTASVTANTGTPTGSVEFFDRTTGADMGHGTLQASGAGTATWTYKTAPNQLTVNASGDGIEAIFAGSSGFAGSSSPSTGPGTITPLIITPIPLTIKATTNTKTYDGTTSAAASPMITGGILLSGDTANFTQTYDNKNVGTGKTITPTGTVNDGNGGKNYTLMIVTDTTGAILAGSFSKFIVNVLGGNTVTAGNSVIVTVQATDQFGNPVSSYTGPAVVNIGASPPDPVGDVPSTVALNTSGFGFVLASLKTAGSYTIKATDTADAITGTSAPLPVTPANAAYFTVAAPPSALTGAPFAVTVKAFDPYQNLAAGYTGKVHLSSSDAKATLQADTTLTGGIGTLTVTLNTAGNQTITATDAQSFSPITISGTSAPIQTSGLMATLTNKPTGFMVTFNKAIDPTRLTLYGAAGTAQDVLLVGKNTNNHEPYPGTLIVDSSNKLATFNVSANFLTASNPGGSVALPDDTYTVTLLSGPGNHGFQDTAGQGLDDGRGGQADFVGTFTTTYQRDKTQVLGITDFARGPNASGDTTTLIKVPNDPANGGHIGIPITIYNAANLTSAGFTLTYNANILTVTGGVSDPSNAAATFHLTSNVLAADGVHSVATFVFTSATPQSGTQILGDLTAYVPYAARSQYQVKDLLALGTITVNGGAAVVPANAIDVNAYFGDVNGDHHLDGLDKGLIANVASSASTGFSAFTLLDPAIIGDLSGDNAVTGNSTSLLSNYLLGLPVAKIPALPNPAIADNLFGPPRNAAARANATGSGQSGGSPPVASSMALSAELDWASVLTDAWDKIVNWTSVRGRRR